jgi:hypothetical protein
MMFLRWAACMAALVYGAQHVAPGTVSRLMTLAPINDALARVDRAIR